MLVPISIRRAAAYAGRDFDARRGRSRAGIARRDCRAGARRVGVIERESLTVARAPWPSAGRQRDDRPGFDTGIRPGLAAIDAVQEAAVRHARSQSVFG